MSDIFQLIMQEEFNMFCALINRRKIEMTPAKVKLAWSLWGSSGVNYTQLQPGKWKNAESLLIDVGAY